MKGLHILAEFHDCACAADAMRDPAAVRRLCLAACETAGLAVVGHVFHGFGTPDAPAGATGAVVLAESHLAVHTWPELDAVTFDLYVCNYSQDNRAAAEAAYRSLAAAFLPGRIVRRDVTRGSVAAS
jgi:spermidine synthase/S-adenosylmethionine decarboxylase